MELRVGFHRQRPAPGRDGPVHFFPLIVDPALQAVALEGVLLPVQHRGQSLQGRPVALPLQLHGGQVEQQPRVAGQIAQGTMQAPGGGVGFPASDFESGHQGEGRRRTLAGFLRTRPVSFAL